MVQCRPDLLWAKAWIARNLLRIGLCFALIQYAVQFAERQMRPITGGFGFWYLLVSNVSGAAAVALIIIGWRKARSAGIALSRAERAVAVFIGLVSMTMVVGDLLFTFLVRMAVH